MSRSTYGTLAIKSIAAETTNISQTVPTTTNNGDIWYDTMFMCKENGVVKSLLKPIFTFTNKGDILTYSTTNATLPVGNNTQILIADSSQVTGVKWGVSNFSINAIGDLALFPTAYGNTLTYKFITYLLFQDRIARINDNLTLTTYTTYTTIDAFLYNEFAPLYKFVMVGGNVFYRSIDGITWTSTTVTSLYPFVAYNHNQDSTSVLVYCRYYSKYYCAIIPSTISNNTVIMSDDAVTWTACSGTGGDASSYYLASIAYDDTGVILANKFRSTDGITFYNSTSYGTKSYLLGKFRYCNAGLYESNDKGISWTLKVSGGYFVDYSPELNMFLCTTGVIYYTSVDGGNTWTPRTVPTAPGLPGYGTILIKWCNPIWVTFIHTNFPRPWNTSTNGITWTSYNTATTSIKSICGFHAFTNA